jgi:polysaccharide pyruvyl transferase CsaB
MEMKVNEVLITGAGSFGYWNAGDEAILAAMVKDLRDLWPGLKLSVVSGNPAGSLAVYGLQEIPSHNIAQIINAAKKSDLLILGGGGLFYDYWGVDTSELLTKNQGGLAFYAGFALLAPLLNKPLMIYSVGVGPLHSEEGQALTRLIFDQAQLATLRDQQSIDLLAAIGADVTRVQVTADPAFNLQPASKAHTEQLLLNATRRDLARPLVGVALRNWNVGVSPDKWEKEVAEALDRFIERQGGTVLLLPFHRPVADPLADDSVIAERLKRRLRNQNRVFVLPSEYRPEEKAGILQQCDLVLAMRLHSAIFALSHGIPVVALSYDPKVANFLEQIDCAEYICDLPTLSAERLANLLQQAAERRDEVSATLQAKAQSLRLLAQENARLAVELLSNESQARPALTPPTVDLIKELTVKHSLRVYELQQTNQTLREQLTRQQNTSSALTAQLAEKEQLVSSLTTLLAEKEHLVVSLADTLSELASGNERLVQLLSGEAAEWQRKTREIAAQMAALSDSQPLNPLTLSFNIARPTALAAPPEPASPLPPRNGRSKPRVAYLTNQVLDWQTRAPFFGGGERYCLELSSLLSELGFEVTLFQGAPAPFEGEFYGFKVIALPLGDWYSEFQLGVGDIFYEASLDYDHVIYNLPEYASRPMRSDAILISHGIWFDHDYHPDWLRFRTAEWFQHLYQAFTNPARIISVDTNVINLIRSLWPTLEERISYIPNWVDNRVFHPPQERNNECLTVLFPRRASKLRGSRLLGDILQAVPHDCRFWWVGGGIAEETAVPQTLAEQDRRLSYLAASFEEMPAFYQQADICVIPTTASEGTSLAALEGLASGCAMVATSVGGLPNLILPEVNGLLVEAKPAAIAAAINFLIENPAERQRLQQAGPQVAAHFDLAVWRQRWLRTLDELGWLETRQPFVTIGK